MSGNNYAVIMAGGIGSRFWPYSKNKKPKQFLDVLNTGKTLIQQTYDRFAKFINPDNIFIIANESYKDLVKEQLKKAREITFGGLYVRESN